MFNHLVSLRNAFNALRFSVSGVGRSGDSVWIWVDIFCIDLCEEYAQRASSSVKQNIINFEPEQESMRKVRFGRKSEQQRDKQSP